MHTLIIALGTVISIKNSCSVTQPFSFNLQLSLQASENKVFKNEDVLIKKCVEWDRSAQTALYKLYAARMFTVCLRYSKNREEAEDILQEGFLKVFESIKEFRKEGSFEGWIRKIMYYTAVQQYRKRKPEEDAVYNIDDVEKNLNHYSGSDTLSALNAKDLIGMVQQLPPRYRMVFNLFAFEGLTHKAIAQSLGITEGTSKSNLSEARAILQRAINRNNPTEQTVINSGRK